MGERKVLNKYIPSDFDPKLVPRGKKPKDELVSVRMMLPFTVQCSTCSTFMYRGRKFNSKKENVKGAEGKYLGIQRYRFYIKCSACSRPMTFLTDPENADYEMETGGTRTFEVHKDRERTKEHVEREEEKGEKEDPMKALENRVLASQKEMADLDNLDEIKAMNMRHLKMMGTNVADATSEILNLHHREEEDDPLELDDEDEALIKSIKFGNSRRKESNVKYGTTQVSRLSEAEEDAMQMRRERELALIEKQQMEIVAKVKAQNQAATKLNPLIKVKRKRKFRETKDDTKKENNSNSTVAKSPHPSGANDDALGLLAGYGSDSGSD